MKIAPIVSIAGAIGLAAVAFWLGVQHGSTSDDMARDAPTSGETPASDVRKVEFWYDPMHPATHFDAPGKSPFMDMQLVPKYADTSATAGVRINPRMVQSLGIRTAEVTRGTFERALHAVGRVEVDEKSIHRVTVRTDGWVEALPVRAEGDHVREHELLAQVYSPAFDTAQREFLLALDSGDAMLIDAARAQLAALDVDRAQVAALERSRTPLRRIDVYAPISGYVMRLLARQGAAVARDTVLFELASHDPIWIVTDIPEVDASLIASGAAAVATVTSLPGRTFDGTVDYVYPSVDAATRTRRARIVLANPDEALHPGMYADVALTGARTTAALLVPTEAVIRTGRRNVVIVAESDGSYQPVDVVLGDERGATTLIESGLGAGDRVVVSGQFLIDSEASLRGIEARNRTEGSAR
jgi:membrane fusion protein, copper/silver efflux system